MTKAMKILTILMIPVTLAASHMTFAEDGCGRGMEREMGVCVPDDDYSHLRSSSNPIQDRVYRDSTIHEQRFDERYDDDRYDDDRYDDDRYDDDRYDDDRYQNARYKRYRYDDDRYDDDRYDD